MNEQIAIQNLLRNHLVEIQSKNRSFSLRAFARKVDLNAGVVSAIINGKRKVSKKVAEKICRNLLLDPQKRSEILELFPANKLALPIPTDQESVSPRYLELEASQFKLIAEWEHYALLSLMKCEDFRNDSVWISERLQISVSRTSEVVERLLDVGLIKRNSTDQLERVASRIRSSDDTINLSLRKSHEVNLDLAQESLNRDSVQQRDFTHMTMAIDPSRLSEAKVLIRKFQDDLAELLEPGKATEVYRFSTQLFPLTKLNKPLNEK